MFPSTPQVPLLVLCFMSQLVWRRLVCSSRQKASWAVTMFSAHVGLVGIVP